MSEAIVIFVTAGSIEEARKIGRSLVEEGLVACCNIVQSVESLFKWQGKINVENESLMIIKTRANMFDAVEKRVLQLHSYEVPEIISLPISHGTKRYLEWIREETGIHQ